jgi:hypothetical protein
LLSNFVSLAYIILKEKNCSLDVCPRLKEDEFEILFNANPAKKLGGLGVAPAKKKGILDAKKSQNIAIQLRTSNIATQDICDALLQGI